MWDDFSTASMLSNAYCSLFQNSGRIARDLNHLRPIHLYLVFLETLALVYIRDSSQIASRIPKAFNLLSKKQQIHNAFQKNIKTTRKLHLVPRVLSLPLKDPGNEVVPGCQVSVSFWGRRQWLSRHNRGHNYYYLNKRSYKGCLFNTRWPAFA